MGIWDKLEDLGKAAVGGILPYQVFFGDSGGPKGGNLRVQAPAYDYTKAQEFQRSEELATQDIDSRFKAASSMHDTARAMDRATLSGVEEMRRQSAQAMAATYGTGGGFGAGAKAAGGRQMALDLGSVVADRMAQGAVASGEQKTHALMADADAAKYANEAGATAGARRQAKAQEYLAQIQQLLAANPGDVRNLKRTIEAMAAIEPDYALAQWMVNLANSIKPSGVTKGPVDKGLETLGTLGPLAALL